MKTTAYTENAQGFYNTNYRKIWENIRTHFITDPIKFVDDYGTWAEAVQEWLNEPLEDIGTIPGFLAFFAYYPATLIAYILEGIWWLLSWVIIGVIKLLVFLIAKIVFILPFILFGGGALMGVFMFAKADKNTSVIIGFALSMIVCITLGVLIFV